MSGPRLLDLFCGAGGCAVGYARAGFEVVGVDIAPQPRYPFEFHQADALTYPLDRFDAIHASPPCQGYSAMRCLPWLRDKDYPMLIEPMRERLAGSNLPWVIESVERSPLGKAGYRAILICGWALGLTLYRHRRFESNAFLLAPPHQRHPEVIWAGRKLGSRYHESAGVTGAFVSVAGQNGPRLTVAQTAMGIDWMTRDELTQAIPPSYTEWVGRQLIMALT